MMPKLEVVLRGGDLTRFASVITHSFVMSARSTVKIGHPNATAHPHHKSRVS
jgi:hypothetical protein